MQPLKPGKLGGTEKGDFYKGWFFGFSAVKLMRSGSFHTNTMQHQVWQLQVQE